jgi:hypothetical protein
MISGNQRTHRAARPLSHSKINDENKPSMFALLSEPS